MNQEIQKTESKSPAELIAAAVSANTDLDKLEKLLQLQERWEANQARKAYHQAMAEFKLEIPVIKKDKLNKQYGSMYCSLDNLVNTVTPVLSRHGLSASWDIKQNGIIQVICRVTHVLGHSETSSMSAESDTSGSKNKIQQIKSTITYLKSVTFESICGTASTDANQEDDGNGYGKSEELASQEELDGLDEWIMNAGSTRPKILNWLKVASWEELTKADVKKAIDGLKQKMGQK